jgi:hypothetical protein
MINKCISLFNTQYQESKLHHAWILEGFEKDAFEPFINHVFGTLLKDQTKDRLSSTLILDKETIGIDDVRKIPAFLEKTAWEGSWRIVVVYNADTMTLQAQNSLLKSLEEPPLRSILFLHCTHSNKLLDTLYSRGLVLKNSETPEEDSLLPIFLEQWSQAFSLLNNRQNATPLMELQAWCEKENIDPILQAKWVLLALKKEIDRDTHNVFLLDCWKRGMAYFFDLTTLKLDTKYVCAKITTALI